MIESKFLEVIDDSTWIPVIAFKVLPQNRFETDLMMRSGYGYSAPDYIFLMKVYGENPEVNHDVYGWPRGTRTMPLAHQYLYDNWDSIKSGEQILVNKMIEEKEKPSVKREPT